MGGLANTMALALKTCNTAEPAPTIGSILPSADAHAEAALHCAQLKRLAVGGDPELGQTRTGQHNIPRTEVLHARERGGADKRARAAHEGRCDRHVRAKRNRPLAH